MCGIYGIVSTECDLSRYDLEPVLSSLRHRGPDAAGAWYSEGASLGSTRLAIIDPTPAGNQPMANEDQTLWIIFNGAIYNFPRLRDELIQRGHRLNSKSDTEVIVHLFEEYGKDCLGYLQGMFAFGIWDVREQRLFLARDRLGIKPLYYAYNGKQLLFSSEVRAILESRLVPRELDHEGVLNFLTFGSVPPPRTIIKGVKALPPGHYIEFQRGQLNIQRYWELSFYPKEGLDSEEARSGVRSLLEQSVRSHLISDVPIGAFLSGGIDSTVIVGLMRQFASGPLRTFNIAFPGSSYDESTSARLVARRFETEHTEREITPRDLEVELGRVIQAMDQPTIDGVNTYFVSKVVKESGTKVALSGLGGDELFCGYHTFGAIPRLHRRSGLFGLVPHSLRRLLSKPLSSLSPGATTQKMAYLLSSSLSVEEIYLAYRSLFLNNSLARLINPDFWNPEDGALDYIKNVSQRCNSSDTIDRISFLELMIYMSNQLLRDTDAMSMAHSLEVRVPYLDHTFVEHVSRLPSWFKVGAAPKQLLLKAAQDLLPPEVANKRKMGFAFPFDPWLRGELKPLISEVLSEENIRKANILQPKAVQSLWSDFLTGRRTIHYSRVWALFVFQEWYRDLTRTRK